MGRGLRRSKRCGQLHLAHVASVLAILLFAAGAFPAAAQAPGETPGNSSPAAPPLQDAELPLSGAAEQLATEAFGSFNRKDYATAIDRAAEAIRQRPDVGRLRTLLIRALDAAGKKDEARHAALQAANDPILSASTREELKKYVSEGAPAPPAQPQDSAQSVPEASAAQPQHEANGELPLTGPAYQIATESFDSFNRKDYAIAIARAREAIRQRPDVGRLRTLLIRALDAAGKKDEAHKEARQAANDQRLTAAARDELKKLAAAESAPGAPTVQADGELPLSGPAYQIATEAYAAFDRRDYASAIARAREAIRQRPDVGRLRTLLVRALDAAGKKDEARKEAQEGANDQRLTAVARDELRKLAAAESSPANQAAPEANAAYQAADAAYRAYDQRDYNLAVRKAQEAVKLDPSNARYRTLLANALAAQKLAAQRDAKGTTAQAAPTQSPAERAANAAYEAIRQHNYRAALEYAREAVQQAPDKRDFRLLLIQLLVQNKRQPEALRETDHAIAQLGPNAALLRQRGVLRATLGDQQGAYADLREALRLSTSASAADKRFLRLSIADAAIATKRPEEAYKVLEPLGAGADYAVWIRRGRALRAIKDYSGAEGAFARAQEAARGANERDEVLAARIGLLVAEGRKDEAFRLFTDARAAGSFATLKAVDLAFLAVQAGDNVTAYEAFEEAKRKGELRGSQFVDAAYAARRAYRNQAAIEFLRDAIDAEERGEFKLDPQALFGLRRAVADLKRRWGILNSLTYGSSGVSNAAFAPQGNQGRILQSGTELYWRLPGIGYRDGALFEVFARQFTTLSDSLHGPTGMSTMQGSAGARWKPFGQYNFVVEASKLFKIGRYAREDTLLRAAVSDGFDTDLRVDKRSWWTGQYYAEIASFVETGQEIAYGEARLGRSFRADEPDDHLVLTPFVGIVANYDSELANEYALGGGPGIHARYWFREDKYTAPMSYVDLTFQYRWKLDGDERAKGVFAGITLNY